MTTEQERDCYYVLRAMHDGACPNCGHTGNHASFEVFHGGLMCPTCKFGITDEEIKGIESISGSVLSRRYNNFVECRKELRDIGKYGKEK
jgi:hypothetical protein